MKVDEVKKAFDLKKKSGIYLILHTLNLKGYVGSSINLFVRLNAHFSSLKQNKHENRYLQNSWNKYEKDNFEIYVVEYCNKDKLFEREQFYVNFYKTSSRLNGYNLACVEKGNNSYVPFPDDKRLKENLDPIILAAKIKKLAKAAKEHWSDPVNRQKASEIKNELYANNPELKTKISVATSKAMNTPEMKEKVSIAMKKFNAENPEHVKEVTKKRCETFATKEHRNKLSVIGKELWANDEHRNKMIIERKERFNKQENKDKMKIISNDMWKDTIKYKTTLEKRSNITQEQFEQLKELHKLGYKQSQIAKVIGCKKEAVGRILRGESKLYSLPKIEDDEIQLVDINVWEDANKKLDINVNEGQSLHFSVKF